MFSLEVEKVGDGIAVGTICKGGKPISPENPANEKIELYEFSKCLLPLEGGITLLVVSGMPVSFLAATCCYYKNLHMAIAVMNPRIGGYFVVFSVTDEYRVGDFIEKI
jgi:hypothetical protein